MKRLGEKEPAETEKGLPQRGGGEEGGRRERTKGEEEEKKVKFRKKSGKS